MIIEGIIALGMFLNTTPANLNVDPGGGLIDRMQVYELLEKAEVDVPISGICMSACTMYLGLPKVCVEPKTILGFHSASYTKNGQPVLSEFGNTILMEYYPPNIRTWVLEKKALESLEMTLMTAEEAWAIGVKKCEKVQ